MVKGTTIGTVTDFDGNFSLEVPKNGTLVISYVGYKSQEIKVSGRTDFAITLASDNKLLDEVVVVGYGVVKKIRLNRLCRKCKIRNNCCQRFHIRNGKFARPSSWS